MQPRVDDVVRTRVGSPARSSHRIASVLVRALSEAVRHAGVPVEAFVTEARIDRARMREQGAWFTPSEFDDYLASALEMTGDPAFGLSWGERSPMLQFDLVPNLLALAPTVGVALDALTSMQPSLASHEMISLVHHGDRCELRLSQTPSEQPAARAFAELAMSGLVRVLRYLDAGNDIRRVSFGHARPSYGAEYDRIFGVVFFRQPHAGIELDAVALHRARPNCNVDLHQQLLLQAKSLRHKVLSETGYAERLEPHIRAALPQLLTIPEAARKLGMSERSLRRRLAEQGESFTNVLDDVRRNRAHELLAVGETSMKEAAHALGFESASGFHRALRRWAKSADPSLPSFRRWLGSKGDEH